MLYVWTIHIIDILSYCSYVTLIWTPYEKKKKRKWDFYAYIHKFYQMVNLTLAPMYCTNVAVLYIYIQLYNKKHNEFHN